MDLIPFVHIHIRVLFRLEYHIVRAAALTVVLIGSGRRIIITGKETVLAVLLINPFFAYGFIPGGLDLRLGPLYLFDRHLRRIRICLEIRRTHGLAIGIRNSPVKQYLVLTLVDGLRLKPEPIRLIGKGRIYKFRLEIFRPRGCRIVKEPYLIPVLKRNRLCFCRQLLVCGNISITAPGFGRSVPLDI